MQIMRTHIGASMRTKMRTATIHSWMLPVQEGDSHQSRQLPQLRLSLPSTRMHSHPSRRVSQRTALPWTGCQALEAARDRTY